jgi:hypothetical protein
MANQSSTAANHDKQLHDAKVTIKSDALLMKKSLDKPDFLEALKYTTDMLNKLSSTARIGNADVLINLSPKSYYELCKT